MEKWMVAAKRADFKGIGERFGIDQVTARIIRNRDVIGEKAIEKYLHGSRKDFYSPWLLKDMEKAVAILQEKIENRNRIRIIGDYDIDGVMSTYILLESCRIRQSIDWKPINAKLEEMRSKSMRFLENALTAKDEQ